VDHAQSIIEQLRLEPLVPEGGWFRQYFLDPERDATGRPRSSIIHFLITPVEFSALHRLHSAETWKFQSGAPVELLLLSPDREGRKVLLGSETGAGQQAEITVPRGIWQGARPLGAWSLVECAMTPAWEESEFELGRRDELAQLYPAWAEAIATLTR